MLIKNIVIINGHPSKDALNFALLKAYIEEPEQSGAKIRDIKLADMSVTSICNGYRKRMDLEPDLIKAWGMIL